MFILTESILSMRIQGWLPDEPTLIDFDEAHDWLRRDSTLLAEESTDTELTFGWTRSLPDHYIRKAKLEGSESDIAELRTALTR